MTGPGSLYDQISPTQQFVADCELASEVERRSRPCVRTINGLLFRQGQIPEALYYVRNGGIALWMESATSMVHCVKAGPGSLVGIPAVIGNKPSSMTAAPCSGAEILEISREQFLDLLASKPELAMQVIEVLAAEVREARQAYLDMFRDHA